MLSKSDERDFVDVRWLSPHKSQGYHNSLHINEYIQMEESSSSSDDDYYSDENVNDQILRLTCTVTIVELSDIHKSSLVC